MLSEKQIEEIRSFLDKSERPLFFYDNDPDGLCSYLLMRKKYDKGYGIVLKTGPVLDASFLRKVDEYYPDLIVVLDKATIDQTFLDAVNVPVVWIDHHPLVSRKGVHYYNSRQDNGDGLVPTTYLVYQVTGGPMWLAGLGCISDAYIPPFYNELKKEYPDLFPKKDTISEISTKSKFGDLIKTIYFILKGKTSETRASINTFSRIENPYEIINNTTSQGSYITRKAAKYLKEYKELLERAKKEKPKERIFLFLYNVKNTSFTSELATDLCHMYPNKIIIVGRIKDELVKMSIRSETLTISDIVEKSLVNVKGYGGGHAYACGGCIALDDFNRFMDNFTNILNEKNPK